MLADIQSQPDHRMIPIRRVGVTDVKWLIYVSKRNGDKMELPATIDLFVDLPHNYRGTHMSRFLEILSGFSGIHRQRDIIELLQKLKERLNATSAETRIRLDYPIVKKAPLSDRKGFLLYPTHIIGTTHNDGTRIFTGVEVTVQSVCPCSKAISRYGAHNQRAKVKVTVESAERIWFEELIEICEKSGSQQVYPILKRIDEKHVTETAYDNPKFVEDIARDVSIKLINDTRIKWFRVKVISEESIHPHNAVAEIIWDKKGGFANGFKGICDLLDI